MRTTPKGTWKGSLVALGLVLAVGPAFGANATLAFLDQPERSHYRLNVEPAFVRDNVQRGNDLLRRILDGSHQAAGDARTAGLEVVAFMWSLYDAAARKGQAYEQGSLVVEDRDGHLFHFLLANRQAGTRISSHLGALSSLTGVEHYGMDVLGTYEPGPTGYQPYGENHPHYSQQNILPARKGTVLFIPMAANPAIGLPTQHLFIKMEDHGLQTWYGFAHHGWDYVSGKVSGLVNAVSDRIFGKPAAPREVERKERIGAGFSRSYAAFTRSFQDLRSRKQLAADLDPNAADLGLRAMVAEADRVLANPGWQEAHPAALAFRKQVEDAGLDHLGVRTGSEVILSEAELRAIVGHGPRNQAAQPTMEEWVIDLPEDLPAANPKPQSWTGWAKSWLGW